MAKEVIATTSGGGQIYISKGASAAVKKELRRLRREIEKQYSLDQGKAMLASIRRPS